MRPAACITVLALLSASWATAQNADFSGSSSSAASTPAPVTPAPATPTPTAAGCNNGFASRKIAVISGTTASLVVAHAGCTDPVMKYTVKLVDPKWPTGYDRTQAYKNRVYYPWNYQNMITDSRNSMAGEVSMGGDASNFTVTPWCHLDDTTFTVQLVSATGAVVDMGTKVYCTKAYPMKNILAAPTKVNAWVSTTNIHVLQKTLLAVYSNWNSMVGASLAGPAKVMGDSSFTKHMTFTAFQSAANLIVDGTTDFGMGCDGFSTTSNLTAESKGLYILGGVYQRNVTSCANTSGVDALKALLMKTDVIVADVSGKTSLLTDAATKTVTLGYPDQSGAAIRVALERYALYRFERMETTCGATLSSIPSNGQVIQANLLEERRVYFNGICGVTKCCLGDVCSSQVAADGRSCILPRVAKYGSVNGITLKRGMETFTISAVLTYRWGSGGVSASTHSWTGSELADGQIRFTRSSAQRNYCMQLSCLSGRAAFAGGVTSVGTPICPMESDWTLTYWQRRYASYTSWSYTYYYWSQYGLYKYQSATDKNEYVGSFTRPDAARACNCKVIGVTTYPNWQITFPAMTRLFNGTKVMAKDTTMYQTKDMSITSMTPLAESATATQRTDFCRCWAKADASDALVTTRLAAADCFQCPAVLTANSVMPRFFWRIFSWGSSWYNRYYGETGTTSQRCFVARGNNLGDRTPWQRRCCYSQQTVGSVSVWKYINMYPSTLKVSAGWGRWPDVYTERVFANAADNSPEQICCRHGASLASQSNTCRMYRDRRPVDLATSSPFQRPRGCAATWTPMPPRGWGRGDPYCTTMDGAGFECNFWGEALWTSCGGWKVHTAAEPVKVGAAATIITAVAVSEGNETVVVQRNPQTNNSDVRVNGEEIDEDYSGSYLDVQLDQNDQNLTIVRITSNAGSHEAEVETLTSSLTLSVAPDASCLGKCAGLMGNCDGTAENDIKSLDGNVTLPTNASGDQIFANIVMSYMINNTNMSLFDYAVSVPPVNVPFTPKFVNATVLANCPATCGGDPGCCLDSEVAGPAFATETVATVSTIKAVANTTVPLTGYNWPPNVFLNPNVAVLEGLTVNQQISASDSDGIQSLEVDACNNADITCTKEVNKVSLSFTAQNLTITVVATDKKGAKTTAFMTVSAVKPPPKPATAQEYVFTIASNGFNAANVYEARVFLAKDLATIVNTYWNLKARRQTVTAAPGTTGAPAYTSSIHFNIAKVEDTADGNVKVTLYVDGDNAVESLARLNALKAQSSLELTATLQAVAKYVVIDPEVVTGAPPTSVPSTPVPVPPTPAPAGGNTGTSGSAGSAVSGTSSTAAGSSSENIFGNGAVSHSMLLAALVAVIMMIAA